MSYGGSPYGGRKRHREDDYTPDRRPFRRPSRGAFSSPRSSAPQPAPLQRIKNEIWLMGDKGSKHEDLRPLNLEDLKRDVLNIWQRSESGRSEVFEAFEIGVTELPHKAAYFAALMALINASPYQPKSESPAKVPAKTAPDGEDVIMESEEPAVEEKKPSPVNVAHRILERLLVKLEAVLGAEEWTAARLIVCFFARLTQTPTPVVTLDSFGALLQEFVKYLAGSDPLSQKDNIALIVGEALLILPPAVLPEIQQAVIDHGIKSQKARYDTLVETYTENILENLMQILRNLLSSQTPFESPFVDIARDIPTLSRPPPDVAAEPFAIVAPSTLSIPSPAKAKYTATSTLKLFPDETVPASDDPSGYQLLSLVRDMMTNFQSNRHEGAKFLLELNNGLWITGRGKWFKDKGKEADEMGRDLPGTWTMEHVLLETLLSMMFATPEPDLKSVYFSSLLVELCKISPGTVAPAMGKCVRRLYVGLGATVDDPTAPVRLDAEGVRRFAEWFSTHLSNFNFSWRWPEWEPDLTLPATHPKRVFIDRLIELEIRLAYFERIKKSLPEPFQELPIMLNDPTNYVSPYAEGTDLYEKSEQVLEGLRNKAPAESVLETLTAFETASPGDEGLLMTTDLAIQSLLQIGSKSFSHFLNMLERYVTVLRDVTSTAARRQKLLSSIASFCGSNYHFITIVIDKLVRYQILDPIDVVRWIIATEAAFLSLNQWEILVNTLDLLTTRVNGISARLEADKAENAAAKEAAKIDTSKTEDQIDTSKTQAQLASLIDERKTAIVDTANGLLAKTQQAEASEDTLWWNEGWLKAFARKYAALLSMYKDEIPDTVKTQKGALAEALSRWPAYTAVGEA